jgi:hypothetical protein
MRQLTRRDFFTRGVRGSVAALVGAAAAAGAGSATAEAAQPASTGVSARDLRRMSRADVRQALRRIRAKRRAR